IKGRAHVFAVQGFARCGVPDQPPAYYLCAMQVSVLDLSPVTTGGSGAAALRNSIDLARLADKLGYTRYWGAEHHNLPSLASTAPDIMIGQIAAATARIRVGSGGVMLPNHAPLTVAERFHTLEALFPGRIDLGIGRAPGTESRYLGGAAPPPGRPRRRRFPGAVPGTDADRDPRFSRRAPVPPHPRHAGRRGAAADPSAGLQRLQRRIGRRHRRRLRLCPSLRDPRCRR